MDQTWKGKGGNFAVGQQNFQWRYPKILNVQPSSDPSDLDGFGKASDAGRFNPFKAVECSERASSVNHSGHHGLHISSQSGSSVGHHCVCGGFESQLQLLKLQLWELV